MTLEEFNDADRDEAIAWLRPCVDVSRWCVELADGRPYASIDALLDAAARAASPFTAAEVEGALAQHPRIGERPAGGGAEAAMSRSEQAGVDPADAQVAAALADGNRAYQDRFGYVFIVSAAGRTAPEMLAMLRDRLTNDAETELRVAAGEQRRITRLRLERLLG